MSGFIRPEMARFVRRWAETFAAGVIALVGLRIFWRAYTHYNWMGEAIGGLLMLIGFAAGWAAYRRAQFNHGGDGSVLPPGLIEVTERQISYFTSLGGDTVDIAAMTRLEIRSIPSLGRVWVLKQSEGPTLFIPVGAAGAKNLFDAFSALPGIEQSRLIEAVNTGGEHKRVIWRGDPKFRALT
ncbi:MAG: hypothetical protein GXP03_12015 [Alphaproteobacteria bacterium]|nr:hypothetical protein [Alphaproteobacteria bacterium]